MSSPGDSNPDGPEALRALVRGLHHVAIAVSDLEAARGLYEGALGLTAGQVEFVPDQRVNVLVLRAGAQRIELVEPASEDSPITGFLARRGGGIHHLAWRVDDVDAALEHLRAAGVRLIDEASRPGAHGTRVAFLHPKATGGVLMELVEDPND
jgi:methylmalonyl-CoA/ethylmalonyl-CoA epimerase